MSEHPSFLKMTASFAKAAIKYAAEGFPAVTTDQFNERVGICTKCEFFNEEKEKCNSCGCHIPYKASWKTTDCPKSKWPKLK